MNTKLIKKISLFGVTLFSSICLCMLYGEEDFFTADEVTALLKEREISKYSNCYGGFDPFDDEDLVRQILELSDNTPPLFHDTFTPPQSLLSAVQEMDKNTEPDLVISQNETPHLYTPSQPRSLNKPSCPVTSPRARCMNQLEGYTVNFEDISVVQLIQFISKISGTNFIFESRDLQFNITIVSEDQTSVQDLTAALFQVLKMHDLSVAAQGNNVLIYRNQNLSKVSTVITENNLTDACDSALVTRVFRLYNINPDSVVAIIKPLISSDAIVEVSTATQHLIVSDIGTNVSKVADLLAVLDSPNVSFIIDDYKVRFANPQTLVIYARKILAPFALDNILEFIPTSSSTIHIVSTPFLIHKAMQVLESLDTPEISEVSLVDLPAVTMANNNFFVRKLRYHKGRELATTIHRMGDSLMRAGISNMDFVNAINSVQWIEPTNSIIMVGTNEAIDKIKELLEAIDVEPKQVFIEVLIIDTTLANSLDFGVQWIALGDEQNKLAFATGLLSNVPPNPNLQGGVNTSPGARRIAANPASNPPAIPNSGRDVPLPVPAQLDGIAALSNSVSAFGLGFIGNILSHNGRSFLTLGALLSALEEEVETRIVLNPRIMTEDNNTATFFVGDNIPYQTTSTVIQQTGSVTQNIQYEDVGVELRVTPTIAPDNMVTLQIDQTVAEVNTPIGAVNLTPSIRKTLATTRVHVPDGTFLVLSGHIREQQDFVKSGIPCLGSLPCIGPLFSRSIERRQKRNLIMFIRPKVVDYIDQGLDLTNQEGYDFNWNSNPCSIECCEPTKAPECETYPAPPCPNTWSSW